MCEYNFILGRFCSGVINYVNYMRELDDFILKKCIALYADESRDIWLHLILRYVLNGKQANVRNSLMI